MIEQIAQLKARVAKLERALSFLENHLGVTFLDDGPSDVPADVVALVRKGDRLAAIRLYCERTGAGLKEAKLIVDKIE